MFQDHFLINAGLCAAGIATALFLLRTGMVRRGLVLLVVLAVASDVALVARFVHGDRGPWFLAGLWSMQLAALGAASWLGLKLALRRFSADARRKDELFAAGFQHYLRDELSAARQLYARVHRADPWDAAALVALANVEWRSGRHRRAKAMLRRAQRLDRNRGMGDFIAQQDRRMSGNGQPAPRPRVAGAVATETTRVRGDVPSAPLQAPTMSVPSTTKP